MPSDSKSSFTDATDDASVADSLQGDVADAWKGAVPNGARAELVLEKKQLIVNFPERKAVFLQVGGRWGPAKGNIALYVHRPEKQPVNFIVVASLSTLDSSEIFEDEELATEIKSQLPPSTADICVLRDWPGIGTGNLAIPGEAKHVLDVVRDVDALLGVTSGSKQTGLVLRAKIDLTNDSAPPPPDSVLKRLSDIDRLTGKTSVPSLLLQLAVARTSDAKPLTSVVFSAAVNILPILDNTVLKDISLTLTVTRPTSPAPANVNLKLSGTLVLGVFNSEKPWASTGTLTIDKASHVAELVVAPANQEQSLAELGGIKLGNVQLHVKYAFGQPKVSWDASISARVTVGSRVVDGTVVFKGSRPSYLLFNLVGTLQVGELFRVIVANDLPQDFIELSLADVAFCYSWNSDAVVLPTRRTIQPGLNASALVDLFGIKFNALVAFTPSGKDKGVEASAKLADPIDIIIVSLYEKYNMCGGPRISYLAKDSQPKQLTIEGGLSILGLHFEETTIRYGQRSANSQQSCLKVDVELKCDVVKGGSVPVQLEVFKVNDRTHVHLNGIPLSEILDVINDLMLFNKIRELTRADPCKEIDIPLKDIFYMSFWPKIEFAQKQPEQVQGQPRRCAFEVSFTWTVKCALTKEKVTELEIELFPPSDPLVINIPKQWQDLWGEIRTTLANAVDRIAKHLLENVDKFSEILVFIAARYYTQKWMQQVIRAWLCRHSDAKVPKPIPEPVPVSTITSKQTDDGKQVSLSEEFQKIIQKVRTDSPIIIGCLEDILAMLGEEDPTKIRPPLPQIPCPDDKKPIFIKNIKRLIDKFKEIRDRDWNKTTWEQDYKLVTNPLSPDSDLDLWTSLHEVQIHFGLYFGAYQPVGQGIFFERNESTWPKNGEPDPRPEVEIFHRIDNLTGGTNFSSLTYEANKIRRSLMPWWQKVWDFFGGGSGGLPPLFGPLPRGPFPKLPVKPVKW